MFCCPGATSSSVTNALIVLRISVYKGVLHCRPFKGTVTLHLEICYSNHVDRMAFILLFLDLIFTDNYLKINILDFNHSKPVLCFP